MITVIFKPGPINRGTAIRDESSQFLTHHLFQISNHPHTWRPPTDIYETEDQIIVLVEIAGMHEKDFVVSFDQNILSIYGMRHKPIDERRAFHQMEIPFGDFVTQVELHVLIDTEKIEATYENGFLRVNLPKGQPRRIEIREE